MQYHLNGFRSGSPHIEPEANGVDANKTELRNFLSSPKLTRELSIKNQVRLRLGRPMASPAVQWKCSKHLALRKKLSEKPTG